MTASEISPSLSLSRPPVAKPTTRSELSSTSQRETKAEKKAKRRQKDDLGVAEHISAEAVHEKGTKAKKRKREAESSHVADTEDGEQTLGEKAKKKLKRTTESKPSLVAASEDIPTKKRKNKTGFLDPSEDTSLPEQSKKCLSYAFLQFHRPSKWKFNKARQNWLIRNIWSNEMVSEIHLPLAFGYLAKVQGGVRENLLQSCRTALEEPKIDVSPSDEAAAVESTSTADAEATPIQAGQPAPPEVERTKKSRARALTALLKSSNTV